MFGIVTTGPSSISQQSDVRPPGARRRPSAASPAAGMRPDEIIKGHAELAGVHRASLPRARGVLHGVRPDEEPREPEATGARRCIYISSGYDFNPFENVAAEIPGRRWLGLDADGNAIDATSLSFDPFMRTLRCCRGSQLAEADLVRELSELTRAANRANATFYTIDPARPRRWS